MANKKIITMKRPISPQLAKKKQEERVARKRLMLLMVFVVLTLLMTIFLIKLVMDSSAPNPELYIVREGTITNEIQEPMLVLREEQALRAPSTGILSPLFTNGEKVAKESNIANIIAEAGKEQWNTVKDLEEEYSKQQLNLLYDGKLEDAQANFRDTDQKLLPLIRQLRHTNEDSVYDAKVLAEQLDIYIRERNQEILHYTSDDETVLALLENLEKEKERLSSFQTSVYSPHSGIISYQIDNISARHSEEDFMTMSAKELDSLVENYQKKDSSMERDVREGQEYAVLLSGMYQYFAFTLPNQDAVDYPLNGNYAIALPDLDMLLDQVELLRAENSDGSLVLLFRTASQMETLISQRILNAQILMRSDRGLKVPNEALHIPDEEQANRAEIMMIISGYVYKEEVDILRQDAEYSIVSSPIGVTHELVEGAVIVLNPEVVRDGEQLQS